MIDRAKTINILLVDDKEENLLSTEAILEDLDCNIIKARSGEETLEILLQTNDIALILLDVNMPGMDGFEAAELIRSKKTTRNIPIIFLTAVNRDLKFEFTGYEKGAVDVIFKPIESFILLHKVKSFINLYETKKIIEEKNREMENLIYITTHDFKSPLGNINGLNDKIKAGLNQIIDILNNSDLPEDTRKQVEDITENKIHKFMGYIDTCISKNFALLNGLSDISRMGRQKLDFKHLDMNLILKAVIDTFHFNISELHIDLKIDDLPACYGDENMINQVFSNLLNNAIKYMDPAKKSMISITGKIVNNKAAYCIEDNGIGMAQNDLNKIFDLFYRVNPKGTTAGDGLGLTAVKRIINKHNGSIWAESTLNVGSKFFVILPIG